MKSIIKYIQSFHGLLGTTYRGKFFNPIISTNRKMSLHQKPSTLVAVCQFTAINDKEHNFKICQDLVKSASEHNVKMVFLPEAFDFIGESKAETIQLAEPLNGPLITKYKELAILCNTWLSLGGFHEKENDESLLMSHVIINNNGAIVAVYRKIHLFDVDIPEKNIRLRESDIVKKGNEIIPPINTPVGNIGLGICYDVRFSELSLIYSKMGADILTFPSAFTFETGSFHWEVLLRSRAIENQCYVIAAAQFGMHNKKRSSWGHSMVVDPYGNIVTQASNTTCYSLATIDQDILKHVRNMMPVQQHRRYDLYTDINPINCLVNDAKNSTTEFYEFGKHNLVSRECVFLKTDHTIAFTNLRCVLPGHVLVAPIRSAQRLSELTQSEISDLFNTVKRVQSLVEKVYNAQSSTITVQDGPDAGQTIQHVHVHILPRKPNDFLQNDQIYYELQKHDKGTDAKPKRSETDMANEAELLKNHLEKLSM
uniref:Nitrilase and fragile histidine triad fusion protein NitFhit n=2 Tax=Clastoptera arizonana TaxID=38151 RepID=A0A1B6DP50_9HEMI